MNNRDAKYSSFKKDMLLAIDLCEHKAELQSILALCSRWNKGLEQRKLMRVAIAKNPECVMLKDIQVAYRV